MRIVLAQINPTVGDFQGNLKKILQGIEFAKNQNCDLIVFPELAITGYPPEDLLLLPQFVQKTAEILNLIKKASIGLTVIVGTPRLSSEKAEKMLHNSAAIFSDGKLIGYQDKVLLPTYDVFDERRYFEPASEIKTWKIAGHKVAITICEDLWQHSKLLQHTTYLRDPVVELQKDKPDFVINLSASPYSFNKIRNRLSVCASTAQFLRCPVLLCNQVGGNDSLIFDGNSLYVDAQGQLLKKGKAFQEEFLMIDTEKKLPVMSFNIDRIESLYDALVLGIRDYFHKSGFTKACFGLSGGIDSALVACLATEALGKENILAVAMPSRYSSEGSLSDAKLLAQHLGIKLEVESIEPIFKQYLELLQPLFINRPQDITEENIQARIRGMILMAISNKHGYIVLSTGNKSELAMGYATLYGDMCGGLGVISDVSKRHVYALAHWINRNKEIIPQSTIQKPPSAELKLNQKDSDTLPDYDIIDNVLESYVEEHLSSEQICERFKYPPELVDALIKKIHCSEYKRRQSPPGLRVSEKAFSIGRRFPIVQKWM